MARKSLNNARHAHGCVRCHTRYEDACPTAETDSLCITCRGGRGWQLLIDNARPTDCCVAGSRLATKDQMAVYRLAGGHLWFICTTCRRTHPFNPARPS